MKLPRPFEALLLLSLAAPALRADVVEVFTADTFAGAPGQFGSVDAFRTSARFAVPYAVAINNNTGAFYVADTGNHTIRKIENDTVTTFAGSAGLRGTADGTGNAARFNGPYAIAVDLKGNLFVADTLNHAIRKITPDGVVTTYAGVPGVSGSADGAASAARFYFPNALTVDAAGNVYVADSYNHTIRKITPPGVVTTLAGAAGQPGGANGSGSSARFSYPNGIIADGNGDLFVADTFNCAIRKVTPAGQVTTYAGTIGACGSSDGAPGIARFSGPRGIALEAEGNLYIADESSHIIRKVLPDGSVRTIAGLAGFMGSTNGEGSAARFNKPTGIAVTATGVVYVADTQNHTIRSLVGSVIDVPPAPLDGLVDRSFDAGQFTNGNVYSSVLQPDGKLIIGGSFNKVHGVARHGLARLNADGTLDTTFDPGSGINNGVTGMLLLPAGKLIIYGQFTQVNGVPRNASLARLNADGSLDTAYDPGRTISTDGSDDGAGNANNPGSVNAVTLAPDGKITVLGNFEFIIRAPGQPVPRRHIARFNADGSFDNTFDPGAGFGDGVNFTYVNTAVRLANGKLLAQGSFSSYDGHAVAGLVRINPDGSYDAGFNAGSAAADAFSVSAMFEQADGRVVIPGSFTTFNGVPCTGIVRLEANGAVDGSFLPPQFRSYNTAANLVTVAQQSDGRLLVGGYFHSVAGQPAHNIIRLNSDGTRDTSFDATIAAGPSAFHISTILIRAGDGHIFAGGYFASYGGEPRNNIAWVAPNGAVESTFAGLSGVTDSTQAVYALARQPDGKIVVGGFFSSVAGVPHYNIVRLTPDGTLDAGFDPNLQTEGSVRAIALQLDGKILIAGNFRAVNGIPRGRVARLNSDGTLDLSFDSGIGADGTVSALLPDADGNVFLGGTFQNYGGTLRRRLAKLNSQGGLDPAFDPGAGPSGSVFALADAGGNRLLVAGNFSSYAGVSRARIARVDAASGALDTGFNVLSNTVPSTIYAVVPAGDGKFYYGGTSGASAPVGRLSADGSRDTTFSLAPWPDFTIAIVRTLVLQKGKLLAAGGANSLAARGEIIRLNVDGTIDRTFATADGGAKLRPNSVNIFANVQALVLGSDGKPIVGGIFDRYQSVSRGSLVRLSDETTAVAAQSRKTHGGAGMFARTLPMVGSSLVESRTGGAGGNHQIVLSFNNSVAVNNVRVTSGNGSVAGVMVSGNMATISLTGVADAQALTLGFDVASASSLASFQLPIRFLFGDANGDGVVNSGDAIQTRKRAGQATTLTNFQYDLNADGVINGGDAIVVRSRAGNFVP